MAHADTTLPSVYVFNGPLQYFLCRLIENTYPSKQAIGIQYNESGDFSTALHEIDLVMGPRPFDMKKFAIGDSLDLGPMDRLFLSNRFNPTEVEIYLLQRFQAQHLCAYEDGLALYIDHNFREASWHDGNYPLVIKNRIKELLRQHTTYRSKNIRPLFFPKSRYDQYYSIFPDIPGRRPDAKIYPLKKAFRGLATGPQTNLTDTTSIILSQCLVKDGLMVEDAYIDFLSARIAEIRQTCPSVLFKPHPRDEASMIQKIIDRTGCTLLPIEFQKIPVELYLASQPNTTPIGFWSSTLAYAAKGLGRNAQTFAPALMAQGNVSSKVLSLWASMAPLLDRYGVVPYTN